MIKDSNQVPKKGMNRHTHPSEIKENEYTFAMNANIQDVTGDGDLIITNEPSNIKCSSIKDGYFVLKHKYDRVRDRIYLFVVNPSTGCSEIGYISAKEDFDINQVEEVLCNCEPRALIETPLEDIFQEDRCNYTTVLSDYCEELGTCSGCLNFSKDFPIIDVEIRYSVQGDEIYWNDGNNPDRYLKLYEIDNYFQNVDECEGTITPTCLQCDKLRIFTLYNKPCIVPITVGEGGSLRMGMYAVFAVYSELDGTELTNYFTGTNYVSIFDRNNTLLDQTQLDSLTNKSIRVDFKNLDLDFDYYKVVIAMTTGNDPGIRYVPYGVFPTSQDSVTITQIPTSPESNSSDGESNANINENDLLNQRPDYLHSKIMTEANGFLFLGNLKARREINLQPIVSLLGSFVTWGSATAKENLYENGEATALYKGYIRDESYPLSIRFNMDGGYTTALFPFVARPPFPDEIAVMPNDLNRQSIEEFSKSCGETSRDKVWQFLNTARDAKYIDCPVSVINSTTDVTTIEEHSCITEVEFETGEGKLSFPISTSLTQYIETNREEIILSSNPELEDIKEALTNLSYYGNCTPLAPEVCSDPELVSEIVNVISIEGERKEDVSIPYDQYEEIPSPEECNRLVEPLEHNLEIENIIGAGSTVYTKTPNTNTDCNNSVFLQDWNGAPMPGVSYHLVDMGTTSSSDNLYYSSIPVSTFDDDFKPFLHRNAVWYKANFFNNSGKILIQLSDIDCGIIDDNTSNKIRITVFNGCPGLSEVPVYGRIINDATVYSQDMIVEIDSNDFTGQILTAYIAIDSSMKSEIIADVTITATGGNGVFSVDGVDMNVIFNTDSNTTTSDFITSYGAVLSSLGITYVVVNNVITMTMTEIQYDTLEWNTTSPDINVTWEIQSQKHLLQPPCGCFAMYRRNPTLMTVTLYDNIIFAKEQVYSYTCEYEYVEINDCKPLPNQEGLFSYIESELKYPCNSELWNSSKLVIAVDRIPNSIRSEFESYYVDQIVGTDYILSNEANFMDKGIRHFKFPDNTISPFIQSGLDAYNNKATNSYINPIGFRIDNNVINAFLDIAVDNGLITQEERNVIIGYELFRGDRATERSVVAKGLLFDMMSYLDDNRGQNNGLQTTYYPNYPLNDRNPFDDLNGTIGTSKTDNYFFTFHSPETHFFKPTLPFEIGIEGYQMGLSVNKFSPVEEHVEWVLLGKKARDVAATLAGAEVAFEIIMNTANWTVDAAAGGISAIAAIAIAAVLVVAMAIQAPYKFGKYKYEWLQTFENFGTPMNFAYYGISEGIYKSLLVNTTTDSKLRGLEVSSYLKEGRKLISNEARNNTYYVNNFNREDSVILNISQNFKLNTPSAYNNGDNSRTNIPTSNTGILGEFTGKASSPYVALKRYLPNQYGAINSIGWLSTGYCGKLDVDNSCDIIFGGDTFISRFALKRKFPFFTQNAIGLPPNTPFKYSTYTNIKTPTYLLNRGFLDFKTSDENMNSGFFTIPENKSQYSLWDGYSWNSEIDTFYVKDEFKFLMSYYGFPYFLVESEVNVNYRYAGTTLKDDFYPNFQDSIHYTQEVNVHINEPNVFKYNTIYSSRPPKNFYRVLPVNFSKVYYDKINNLENAIIASDKDDDASSKRRSPWLNYKPANFHRFNNYYGKLIDLQGIESEMLWARFSDGYEVLNAIDTLAERFSPQTRRTGMAGMFQQRAINFNVTDLGYNGTQHRATISTEFGHYSVDAKRGKVFELQPGAKGTQEISVSMDKWFKEQLPFKILNKFPDVNTDNPYNGIGISMGWDDRTKRLFITKRDYIPLSNQLLWSKDIGFYIEEINGDETIITQIELTNSDYFEEAHWTVAYSPLLKTWISYYSFNPFYYISLNDHFKTGLNTNDNKNGIWSHYPLVSSYQVFYGELYPFIIEFVSNTNASKSSIDYVEFILDVKKYYNKYDYANILDKGFNKAYIYNNNSNSGKLILDVSEGDNPRQIIDYPKYLYDSIRILQTEEDSFWTFNYLYDHIRDHASRIPVWLRDNVDILQELNPSAMEYNDRLLDRLRGDYFQIRLIQDIDSRNKLSLRFNRTFRNYYR